MGTPEIEGSSQINSTSIILLKDEMCNGINVTMYSEFLRIY